MKSNIFKIIFVCAFGFFVIGLVSYLVKPAGLTPEQIKNMATKNIQIEPLPPKPEGSTRTETITKQVCTNVPTFRGFQIKNVRKCFDQPKTVERFEGPSDDETKRWEEAVELIEETYEAKVASEIRRIELQEAASFRAYVKDVIQILSGLFGMLFGAGGLFLAIRQDRRENESKTATS